ncbi:MAG: penicillin-binding protein 1C [Proteobacteria bacterium]|nr:penicillin-binding protein 1C [Pseudomonadota bacterium]
MFRLYFATKTKTVTALGLVIFALSLFWPVSLEKYEQESPTMYDQNGELIHIERNKFDCWMLKSNTVDPQFKELLINFEDKSFYYHPGVNPFSLIRAVWQAISTGKIISGGSTLTMQVVRLLNPRPRTIFNKLIEIHTALRLSLQFSKDKILNIYLTLAPYGGNLQGIRAASLYYFAKEPNCLPLSYQAMLVAIPQTPSNLRPDRFIERANTAKNKVLQRLPVHSEAVKEALSETCIITPTPFIKLAPHGFIAQKHGKIKPNCLDKTHQTAVNELIDNFVQKLPVPMNAACIIYNLKTQQIITYVGGVTSTNRLGGNDMCQAKRSPGSLLKPFIYGLAIERGLINPHTIVTDQPINLKGYKPENFDMQFNGELSIEEALQQSLNTPVIQVLNQIGPGYFFDWLKRCQITMQFCKSTSKRPGLAIGLGGVGISLQDLVQLYALLAEGKLLNNIAQNWVTQTLAQTPMPDQRIKNHGVAYKTGTSYGFRDAWSIGYDNDYVVGVWVGKADGTPCPGYHGRQIAAPLMMQIFDYLKISPIAVPEQTIIQDHKLRFKNAEKNEFKITMPQTNTTICVPESGEVFLNTNEDGPTLWYVNSNYLGKSPKGEGVHIWKPDNSGFYEITATNSKNETANCSVQITREPSTN